MKINIIGAGRLGQHLARAVLDHNIAAPLTLCNRNLHTARAAIQMLGSGFAVSGLSDLPFANITFITTPDDAIAGIAAQLTVSPGQIVAHCSGVLNADVLSPLREQGALIASIHPLRAFRAHHIQDNAFQDCDCVIEGDTEAVRTLTTLFIQMGAHVLPISASKKATYHAAAVMASNYLVTLAGCAITLFHEAGLSEAQAQNITENLMQSSLNNIRHVTDIKQALTGPLARGDINTVSMHLDALQSDSIKAFYRTAALTTLPLTDLDDAILHALKKRLAAK